MLPRALLVLACGFTLVFGYPDDYNQRMMMTNDNQSAVFCYINGTRLVSQSQHNIYRNNYFTINHVKVELCTHIVYGAAVLDPHTWGPRAIDQDLEQQTAGTKISFDAITELARRSQNLKVLISVSGNSREFSEMARSHREHFVKNAQEFLRRYKFDGMNIDWQYPTRRGGRQEDRQNFGLLMKELKIAFRNEAKLLSASLSPIRANLLEGYDYVDNVLMESVDYWFIMAMEYYGHWSSKIGANAPIKSREQWGVEKTIMDTKQLFQQHSYKLILVIPFYGKKYQLKEELKRDESPIDKDYQNIHAPAESVSMSYREICQKMNNDRTWRQGFDHLAKVPYIVKDTSTIVYEDAQSVQEKTALAMRMRLGGVMAFSLDMDDFTGDCNVENRQAASDSYNYNRVDRFSRRYPLLQSMYDTVQRGPNSAGIRSSSLSLIFAALLLAVFKMQG